MGTITAANSIFMLSVPLVFATPTKLQGYAADAAFDTEAVDIAEVMKGVDGIQSAGFIPFMTQQTISLQADSESAFLFEDWVQAMKTVQETYPCNATISLPSIQRKYTLSNGVLLRYVGIAGTRKVLQPRSFVISWDDISPSPM